MATQNRPEGADEAREPPPSPDGPGPRDVPDDEVIDKTLPTRGSRDAGDEDG